jgi:hypothetical protein
MSGKRRRKILLILSAVFIAMVAAGVLGIYWWRDAMSATYATSCANHTIGIQVFCIIWCNDREEKPDGIFPRTMDFQQALKEMGADETTYRLNNGCAEAVKRFNSFGFLYVAGGVPVKTIVEKQALIFFCPAECHRGKRQHAHAMRGGEICVRDNEEMMQVLSYALHQGETGEVPYSPEAIALLREQVRLRSKSD